MKLRPIRDQILIQPEPQEERTKSGILLPKTAKMKHQTGKVLAVGPGRVTDYGKLIEPVVRVGERVLVREFNLIQQVDPLREGEPVLVPEGDIVAVIEG